MLNRHGGVEADLTVSAIDPGAGVSVHDPAFQGQRCSGITREERGAGPPRVTPSRGVTPEGKKFCGQIYKE